MRPQLVLSAGGSSTLSSFRIKMRLGSVACSRSQTAGPHPNQRRIDASQDGTPHERSERIIHASEPEPVSQTTPPCDHIGYTHIGPWCRQLASAATQEPRSVKFTRA